jgi:transglutaminase-like putative cysteine protease
MLYARPGRAQVLFNGKLVDTGHSDKFFRIPVEWVKKGENEVVLRGGAKDQTRLKLAARKHILEGDPARTNRPPRSFRSTNGAQSWEPLEGELTIRLHLAHYAPRGSFSSPVLDLASDNDDPYGLAPKAVRSIAIRPEADTPPGTTLAFALRFGATPLFDRHHWTAWQAASTPPPKDCRYAQWSAMLSTEDPKRSPWLKRVTLEAQLVPEPVPAWATGLSVATVQNAEVRYTSMPFTYEDSAHPRLQALRAKYRLDQVVSPGKTELEKLVLLRDWVAQQWRYHPPEGHYPAWDADEILSRGEGMCVQYAIVYIECCSALGYQARYVCGFHPGTLATAHEVAEVWSDDECKWILMDPTRNEMYVDPKSGQPLSLLETHDRMMKEYYGDAAATYAHRPTKPSWSARIALARGPSVRPTDIHGLGDPPPKVWPPWTKWLSLCCLPRNDFYSQPRPLPRLQGWNDWDWTGFWSWYDAQTPRDWRYRHFTCRRSDLEWTLNQVRFGLAYGNRAMAMNVKLATVTPNFDTFLVSLDGKGWTPSGSELVWDLHSGANRLDMRVRNTAGVLGSLSTVTLLCKN